MGQRILQYAQCDSQGPRVRTDVCKGYHLIHTRRLPNMPIVQIELIEGRTVEQKRVLAEKVTRAIVESLSCPETAVSIIMREMQTDNFAKAGKLWCDK